MKTMLSAPYFAIGLVAILGFSGISAFAADDMSSGNPPPPGSNGSGNGGGHHHELPAEAFTACNGKAAGDAISITTPDGKTISATCVKFGDKLAARPNQPPPRQ